MMNDNLNIGSNSNSSVPMASDECAPAVEAPAPFAVTVGASNSGAA
jgi:hypothetical protein